MNSSTVITSTSEGTSKGTIAPSSGNSAFLSLNASDGYRYFWLNLAGGASFLSSIEIEYSVADATPTITTTPTSISGLSYTLGGTSTAQSFLVTGSSLSSAISVTAPSNFEISATSGGTYSSTLSLAQTGGTVYVRLKSGLAVNSYSGDIALASGSTSASVAVSGAVTAESETYNGIGTFEKITSLSELTDGYYVILSENDDALMTNGRSGSIASGYFISSGDFTLDANNNVVNPATSEVWKIETNGSGRTIYNEPIAKYVGWSSGNGASIEDAPANSNRWTFSYADNKWTVKNVATTTRQLSYNSGSPRFAAYGNTDQKELQLYKYTISCTSPNLAFAVPTVAKTVNSAAFTIAPTTLNTTGVITYTSSDPLVATVASGGTVTIVGEGTATITATQAAGSHNAVTYCAATASYVLTVAIPPIEITNIVNGTTWEFPQPAAGEAIHVYEKNTTSSATATELFFSKYLEGQGNNKLLEIFNGTASSVNLSDYKVQVCQIGGSGGAISWSGATNYILSGTLAPGETKVIYTRATSGTVCSAFDASWQEFTTSPALQFNGNDPIRLVKTTDGGTTWHPIDIIGQSSGSMSTAYWGTSSLNTDRVFLVRKTTVTEGATAVSNNTNDFVTLATEWEVARDIDAGSGGSSTCDAIAAFGEYDYNETYESWTEVGTVSGNQVTINNAATRPCEELKIEYVAGTTVNSSSLFRIPRFIAANTTSTINAAAGTTLTSDICKECDIVVESGATLSSTSGVNQQFKNAFVLPGGKLDLATGTTWAVNDIFAKADNAASGCNLYNSFPTAAVKLGCNFAPQGSFKYVRKIDDQRYYFISFPYAVNVSDIVAMNGSLGTLGSDWYLQSWNGQKRADRRVDTGNWEQISTTNTVLTPCRGYVIGLADGRPVTEVVFPIAATNLRADASVTITLNRYSNADNNPNADHDNWNVVGLPYICKNTGAGCGLNFVVPVNGTSNVFTYLSSNNINASNALNPFISYFMQAPNSGSTDIIFNTGISFVPSAVEVLRSDIRIHYQSATGADYMNLVLDDNENDDYNFGVDLVKWVGTGTHIPQIYMSQGGHKLAVNAVDYASAINIPVSVYNRAAGQATFSADREGASSQLTALILTDTQTGATTNLLFDNYTYSATAGTDASRFVLSAQRMPTGTTTVVGSDLLVATANGTIRIEGLTAGTSVRIFDTLGRALKLQTASDNVMEISNLPKGTYIVQTIHESKTQSVKVVL